jgi:hypothetical protein
MVIMVVMVLTFIRPEVAAGGTAVLVLGGKIP